jgi:ABC-type transport system involved in multi-copper enzyme maturation permease subunit
MATFALILDTIREAMARKVFWAFFFASSAILLFFMFIMHVDVVNGIVASMTIFQAQAHTRGELSAEKLVQGAQGGLSVFLYTIGMGLAIFASAGLISAVFEPGRVELVLSKPVGRTQVLLGRYVGNLLIVAANLAYLTLGVWIIFGVKVGVWRPHLLLASVLTLFMFSVMLAFILFISVLWESAAVSIIATFALIVICLVLGAKDGIEKLLSNEFSRDVVDALYYILPKVPDAGKMMTHVITGQPIENWMPVWSSALFGIVALGSGLWIFQKRNF